MLYIVLYISLFVFLYETFLCLNEDYKMFLLFMFPFRQRIPSKNVYYYRCPDHRKNYVMSFPFAFDKEGDTYQFAYCYPYSYTRMQTYLAAVEKRKLDYFNRELLCLSVVGKVVCYGAPFFT